MNAATISNYPDPFIEILQIRFPSDIRKYLQDPELEQIYDSFQYPKLQQSDIQIISERFSKGLSYNECLKGISYFFSFRPSSLQIIYNKCYQDASKRAQFAICFILHSYVAFCLLLEKNKSTSYLPVLLQSLNTLLGASNLSIKAFVRLVSYYSIVNDFHQIKAYLPIFYEFYKNADLKNQIAFDVIADLFNAITNNGAKPVPDEAFDLYRLISIISDDKPQEIPQEAAIKIANSIRAFILDMKNDALYAISHISPLLGNEYMTELAKEMVKVIVTRIMNEEPTITIDFPSSELIKLDKPEQVMEPIFHFQEIETFPDGFHVLKGEHLPPADDISTLCKPETLAKSKLYIVKALSFYEEATAGYLEKFEDSITVSEKNKHYYDLMAHFLHSAVCLSKNVKLPGMVRFLFSDLLFNPRIICSIDDSKTKQMNSLRNAAFELILNEGATAFEYVLNESMSHPLFYAELMYRCLNYQNMIVNILPTSKKLLNVIITSSLYYQRYCFKGERIVETVRLAIFLFFSSIFNNRNAESYISCDSYFISSFLSFLFEEPVRPFITTQLKSYLTKDNQTVEPLLGEEIDRVFEIARSDFPSTRALKLANAILLTMIDSVSHQHQLVDIFRAVINSIVKSMPSLTPNDECQAFLLNTLQFFGVISNSFKLSMDQLNAIEEAIQTVYERNIPQQIFTRIIHIMAGDCILTSTPTFIIRQPLLLTVFVKLFRNTPRYKEVLKFIYDLCTYTSLNSIACHSSLLDQSLLESIKYSIDNLNEKNENIDLILSLFTKIAFSISSPDIVSLFLSLLCPTEGKGMSIYFGKLLLSLNNIVSSTLKSPETSIPLPKEPILLQDQIDVCKGFTFIMWIEMDSIVSQYKPNIFSFYDPTTPSVNYLRVSLLSNVLMFYQRDARSESSGTADTKIPLTQWSFIAISYVIENEKASITVSVNGKESRRLKFPTCGVSFANDKQDSNNKKNRSKLFNFSFFGVADDSVDPDIPVLIGPFALFPLLDSSIISQLYGIGPKQLSRVPVKQHFIYIPQIVQLPANVLKSESESNIELTKDESIPLSTSMESFSFKNPVSSSTFLKVLIKNCKITSLLPLFSFLDKSNDIDFGNTFQSIGDILVELISNCLLMSDDTELEFARLHGFDILSDLLMSNDPHILTYSTYSRFFSLLQMLRTSELQRQLIRSIVVNFELWITTDSENQLRILKHWSRVLFSSNLPTDDFSSLLTNLVLYYWDDPCNRNYLKGLPNSSRPRPTNLNVAKCRGYLVDVLFCSCQKKLTKEDFYLLISYIKHCQDKGTILSLTNLLLRMCKTSTLLLPVINSTKDENGKISKKQLQDIETFISVLHSLFKRTKFPEIAPILIEAICMLHINGILLYPSFDVHIEMIIHRIPQAMITTELYEYLHTNLLPQIPQILPLCFWVAFNLSDVIIDNLVTSTEPSPKFAISPRWALWPIIISTYTCHSISSSILVFLAKCGNKQWIDLFATILIVCKALNKDCESILSLFLTYISNCILCQMIPITEDNLSAYFTLVRHFLFFRDSKEKRKELLAAFRFSPFDVPKDTSPTSTPIRNQSRTKSMAPDEVAAVTMQSLIDQETGKRKFIKANSFIHPISTYSHPETSFNFGVRLDERLRWKDLSLARNTLNLIELTSYVPAIDIDLIICTFILRDHPEIVQQHLPKLKLTPSLIDQYQMYIDLLCYKSMRLNITAVIEKYRSRIFPENASKALFETAQWNMEMFITMPLQVHQSIKIFFKEFKKGNPMANAYVDDELNTYLPVLKQVLSNQISEYLFNGKLWANFWDAITSPGSIWENASKRNLSLLRDKVGCFSNCPFKIKPVFAQCPYLHSSDDKKVSIARPDFTPNCVFITNLHKHECEFKIFNNRIEITMENNRRKVMHYRDIIEIIPRTHFHQENSIEIFMKNRKSYFFSFFETNENKDSDFVNDFILSKIAEHNENIVNLETDINIIQNQWINKKLSNFEYLLALNKISGRSFNDITNYPLFPWIIKDYTNERIKLTDMSLYRDLSRPIGALNDERIKRLRSRVEEQKSQMSISKPYLYDSSPLSVNDVLSYLGNLPPYKSSSSFSSINKEFSSVTSNQDDFRELIPEFFFEPEVFNNVELPNWSSDSLDFVYLNRKVLESEHISATLNDWIDLIWGYNTRGREAVKQENTYMPELYDTIWRYKNDDDETSNTISDNIDEEKVKFLMKERGLIPKQLFKEKHPSRLPNQKLLNMDPITINAQSNTVSFAHVFTIPNENKIVITYIDASGILKKDTVTFSNSTDGKIKSIANVETFFHNVEGFNFVSDFTKFDLISADYILVSDDSPIQNSPMIKSSTMSSIFLDIKSSDLTLLINTKTSSAEPFSADPLVCFESSYPYLATMNEEFLIKVYKLDDGSKIDVEKPFFAIPCFRTSAKCITISDLFHIIVVGGINELLLYSISSTTLTRVIKLDDGIIPSMVQISPSWGFIIVYATMDTNCAQNNEKMVINALNRYSSSNLLSKPAEINQEQPFKERVDILMTFSVNGALIRKTILPFKIVAMTTWKSANGFDFIAFANEKGKVYVCEAYYLDLGHGKPVLKCSSPVKTLTYSEELQMLIAVTKDGAFWFKPYSPNDSLIIQAPRNS